MESAFGLEKFWLEFWDVNSIILLLHFYGLHDKRQGAEEISGQVLIKRTRA